MRIIICEDNINEGNVTKNLLIKEGYGTADDIEILSPTEVMVAVTENIIKCDIFIMDIEFKDDDFDGIKLSHLINEYLPMCQIIYLSNYIDYAPEVYETEHCFFVVKKNAEIMLGRAMKKAVDLYEKSQVKDFLTITVDGSKIAVGVDDIIYMEKNQRKVVICTKNGSLECYQSLRALLGKSEILVRCHGSYVINLKHIEIICKDEVVLDNGTKLPIGRNYQKNIKEHFLKHWSNEI